MRKENHLKAYRLHKGLTINEVADALGITTTTIIRWENGTSRPSPLAALKLEELGYDSIALNDTKNAIYSNYDEI